MSSNFPNGFAAGVTIRGIPLFQAHPGEVFWVNNSTVLAKGAKGGSNGNDGSRLAPFSTLTFAITQCRANRGDIVVLAANHDDSLAAGGAGALTLDVAGVAIVGQGIGTKMAKIKFTGATDTIVISAANQSFYNINFEAAVADVAEGLNIGAVNGLSFESCIFTEGNTAGTFNYVDVINLETGCDNFSMANCGFFGRDTNNDQCITGVAHDGFYLDRCQFYAAVAQATAVANVDSTGNVVNMEIKDCYFVNNVDAAVCLSFAGSANSGVIKDTHFGSTDAADFLTGCSDASGAHFFRCKASGDDASYGAPAGGAQIYNNA